MNIIKVEEKHNQRIVKRSYTKWLSLLRVLCRMRLFSYSHACAAHGYLPHVLGGKGEHTGVCAKHVSSRAEQSGAMHVATRNAHENDFVLRHGPEGIQKNRVHRGKRSRRETTKRRQ